MMEVKINGSTINPDNKPENNIITTLNIHTGKTNQSYLILPVIK